MTHAFALRLDQLFRMSRVTGLPARRPEKPLQIEVERLPDYRWRDLGFQQPKRPDESE